MSQRSMALNLITLLAGVAAGVALMAGYGAHRPSPAAHGTNGPNAALAAAAVARSVADAQPPSATTWRSVPEVYPAIEGATQADVTDESINSLGNLGDGS